MANVMLTTVDNPYNPFTNFDSWYSEDQILAIQQNRATCCGYLARMADFSEDLSDKEVEDLYEMLIDDICELNLSGTFIKVDEESAKERKLI